MDKQKYDFSGWATRNDLTCSDGRTIRRDAFKHCDGKVVPLVWNHQHSDPHNVLGHALLENREDGVYAYCSFNETESAQAAKLLVQHGDVDSLSIYANGLKQNGGNVMHGDIREVSLVVAGANPGAFIDFVSMAHGEEGSEEEVIICPDEPISLAHSDDSSSEKKDETKKETEKPEKSSDDETVEDVFNTLTEKQKTVVYAMIGAALDQAKDSSEEKSEKEVKHSDDSDDDSETVADVFDTLTEKQKTAVYAMIGAALEDGNDDADAGDNDKNNDSKGGKTTMKHNVFDQTEEEQDSVLSHADWGEIITMAKMKTIGSLQSAAKAYCEQHQDVLKHGYESLDVLFPDYKDVRPGAPELITRDQGWITVVLNKVNKAPFSRIRTRQADLRVDSLRGSGYEKTKPKKDLGNVKLLSRTTDPQTIYVKDKLNRDDIVDITDFDFVQYQWGIMRNLLNEEVAVDIMVGDGREEHDEQKVQEEHVHSIWHDDDVYTIHYDIDMEKARNEVQGSRTSMNFGEDYIFAAAFKSATLNAFEGYKGSGNTILFCTPHLLNRILLAKDLNGRDIYESKAKVAAALNVSEIYTAEQFVGLERTDKDQKKHKLLGIFVNLSDYTIGATKGGEIARFSQFDIDFNQEKYLLETRMSGALTRAYSAIAIEEAVNP